MTDIARQAAAKIERRYIGGADDDPLVIAERKLLAEMIEADGTLVSHADAELLRQVKRMMARATDVELTKTRDGSWGASIAVQTQPHWNTAERPTLTAALKSALDAAGVPDEKGAE